MSRSYTGYTCGNGTCNASSGTEYAACYRDTNGWVCDDNNGCSASSNCSNGVCAGNLLPLYSPCLNNCECQTDFCWSAKGSPVCSEPFAIP
jgi:hypothetical protein